MIHTFRNSISDSANLRALHHHCADELQLLGDYDDLLRMGFIYCLSAFDKLVHDLVIFHMVETFAGRRTPTAKYLNETINLSDQATLATSIIPPPEIVFEGVVRNKISHLSFMDPDKLVDALSWIWDAKHKWQVIAAAMGRDSSQTSTELRNLYKRRNAIVHETDRFPKTSQKTQIFPSDVEQAETFILSLGETINSLI